MASSLPWIFSGETSYEVAHTWTVLDDLRVAEVAFEDSRKRLTDPDVDINDHQAKTRHFRDLTEMVRNLRCFTIYNDKQLWLAFKYLHTLKNQARIEIASNVDRRHGMHLHVLSLTYFKVSLPYDPNVPGDAFSDRFLGLNVGDINWSYYYV